MRCPIQTCCPKILAMPKSAALIFMAAAGALIFAFIMQYGFDVEPCVLCLWQRVPFAVAALLSLTALLWKPYGHLTIIILMICAAVFAVGAGLAIFHTGVELHWWLGTSGCAIQPLHGSSVEDLRTELLHTVVARCDQISWRFLGLSMANWNVPFSSALAIFSGSAASRVGK
jgi:disulfide bond formation protein DsbB